MYLHIQLIMVVYPSRSSQLCLHPVLPIRIANEMSVLPSFTRVLLDDLLDKSLKTFLLNPKV
jgi:hypothetical protein